MNLNPFAIVAIWVLAMAILIGIAWWRKWHRELAAARHTYRAAEQDVEAATAFYGSMDLDAEHDLYWPAPTRWEVAHEDERAWIGPALEGIAGRYPGLAREVNELPLAPDRCGLYPAEPRCEACPYWPVCQEADAGHWNDPRARPLDWRERTMAELAPEALDDPGPGDHPPLAPSPGPGWWSHWERQQDKLLPIREDAQRRDERVCANDSRPAAGADLTGSLSSRPLDEDPGQAARAWPGLERLADTGDIRDAALLADTTTYMRDQDADVADWLAGRAITWARLEIGALT